MSIIYLMDPRDTLKMLRETLCVAQTALGYLPTSAHPGHADRIGRVIDEIDRQRPLGSDGKHGDRHTPTCGCEDIDERLRGFITGLDVPDLAELPETGGHYGDWLGREGQCDV